MTRLKNTLDLNVEPSYVARLLFLLLLPLGAAACSTVVRKEAELLHADRKHVFESRCEKDASEAFVSPAENIVGILRIDVTPPGLSFVGGMDAAGNSHPHYMFFRLGLDFIEFESALGPSEKLRATIRVGRFDLHERSYTYHDNVTAKVGVKFENIGTIEEERLGVRGRRITVYDLQTGKVHATRSEFFARRIGVCPELTKGQSTPISFLSRAINPTSYGCWHRTENKADFVQLDKRTKAIEQCHSSYWDSRRQLPDRSER